ncbi:DEAD/DEAH box helicase [Simiduia sp. 21SJ11W-1]|uniref:helicase-related protein n=1 Tax=Simiduia sp. 21SJ11W-1 TaxID=2909669 RepID=UPI0020A0115E|nr:helicase-related protein [Simiduia sp. 21SJ11W-1]UTA47448.1 DEAD/DEAH box helicase [Simiduia sp. 21SJ11W-1]
MSAQFSPGSIVRARRREWVVLPQSTEHNLYLRPLGSGEDMPTLVVPALEREPVTAASFPSPTVEQIGTQTAGLLLRDALMLKLRAGAGPFRSFGNIAVEPRAYQLVPLMMALKQEVVRLLIADDVGIGKTIEAGLIARELMDRGEINALTVLCPPHLCEQWQEELQNRFHIDAVVVRSATANRLERGIPAGGSIFTEYPFTVVSLDFIKSKTRRDAFAEQCPDFVIVDEAHTCSRTGQGRQQRYELLRDLAAKAERHLVMLTATPHSGDEEAFYNLLALLSPDFAQLKNETRTDHPLRAKLANHFVQRRRQDIDEWKEGSLFPDREVAEAPYKLTGDWNGIFQEVLDYARELVERETESRYQMRMNWWAALALLRCISSSPQAAVRALGRRLDNAQETSDDDAEELDAQGLASVLDGTADELVLDDVEPGAAQQQDIERLTQLIARAEKLSGSADPKLQTLVQALKPLIQQGFHPVVFCRYIATADYLAAELAKVFTDREVVSITGELAPSEREARIAALKDADKAPLLVATDCLSEGINLQDQFTAVVHYDLSWNPTRHEQREGRVDRFGQRAPKVKALMLYGEDNPIDGAVLQVILRKAENIRKALGVSVPMPEDDDRVMNAILNTVLLRRDATSGPTGDLFAEQQMLEALDVKWESAREKAKKNQTLFAQGRLKPEQVMPEWQKAFAVLGTEEDVKRFVLAACERLGAPLDPQRHGGYRAPLGHLPKELVERLERLDLLHIKRVDFHYPTAERCEFLHRTHPLVGQLADYLAELAMAGKANDKIARAGALFTQAVQTKTTIYLLRLRSRLTITRTHQARDLLAEEALALAVESGGANRLLPKEQALALMQSAVSKELPLERRTRELQQALDALPALMPQFEQLADDRAQSLLADHRRVREAAGSRGSYSVSPQLPVDVMGVYVLVPDVALF